MKFVEFLLIIAGMILVLTETMLSKRSKMLKKKTSRWPKGSRKFLENCDKPADCDDRFKCARGVCRSGEGVGCDSNRDCASDNCGNVKRQCGNQICWDKKCK